MNDEISKSEKNGEVLRKSVAFRKQYAYVLVQLKIINDQVHCSQTLKPPLCTRLNYVDSNIPKTFVFTKYFCFKYITYVGYIPRLFMLLDP